MVWAVCKYCRHLHLQCILFECHTIRCQSRVCVLKPSSFAVSAFCQLDLALAFVPVPLPQFFSFKLKLYLVVGWAHGALMVGCGSQYAGSAGFWSSLAHWPHVCGVMVAIPRLVVITAVVVTAAAAMTMVIGVAVAARGRVSGLMPRGCQPWQS